MNTQAQLSAQYRQMAIEEYRSVQSIHERHEARWDGQACAYTPSALCEDAPQVDAADEVTA